MQQIWRQKYNIQMYNNSVYVWKHLDPVRYLKILMFFLYVNSSMSFTYYITWALKGIVISLHQYVIIHVFFCFFLSFWSFSQTACLIDTKLGKNVPLQILCFCSHCKSMMTTNVEIRGHMECYLFFVCRAFFSQLWWLQRNLQWHYIMDLLSYKGFDALTFVLVGWCFWYLNAMIFDKE